MFGQLEDIKNWFDKVYIWTFTMVPKAYFGRIVALHSCFLDFSLINVWSDHFERSLQRCWLKLPVLSVMGTSGPTLNVICWSKSPGELSKAQKTKGFISQLVWFIPRLVGLVRLCVCLGVCLFVSTLTAVPFDIWSRNLVQGLTLMISWTSPMVNIIGQRSRSPGQKTWFPGFSDLSEQISNPSHGMTSWCHDIT